MLRSKHLIYVSVSFNAFSTQAGYTKGSWWHYVSSRVADLFFHAYIVYLHFTLRVCNMAISAVMVHWLCYWTRKMKTNYPAIEIHLWWSTATAGKKALARNNALTSATAKNECIIFIFFLFSMNLMMKRWRDTCWVNELRERQRHAIGI